MERHCGHSKDNFLTMKEHTEGPDCFKRRGLDGGPNIHAYIGTMINSKSPFQEMGPSNQSSSKIFSFSPSKTYLELAAGCDDQIHSPTTHRHNCFVKDLLGCGQ